MSKAVLHIDKSAVAGGLSVHIERKTRQGAEYVPNNADSSRTALNFSINDGKFVKRYEKPLHERIEARIAEGHTVLNKDGKTVRGLRPDAVRSLNLIMSGTRDAFMPKTIEEIREWAMDCYQWTVKEFGGEKNIVGFTVHLDEHTPHIHCTVVPIDGNKLCAYSYIGKPSQLEHLQTSFAEAVEKHGFARGKKYKHGIDERITHTTTAEFYAETQELEESERQSLMQNVNIAVKQFLIEEVSKRLKNKRKSVTFASETQKQPEQRKFRRFRRP